MATYGQRMKATTQELVAIYDELNGAGQRLQVLAGRREDSGDNLSMVILESVVYLGTTVQWAVLHLAHELSQAIDRVGSAR